MERQREEVLVNSGSKIRTSETDKHSETKQANGSKEAQGRLSIVIAATFTANLIQRPFDFWMAALDIPAEITLAPYAQVMQELLDCESLLSHNKCGFDVLLIRLEDWILSEQSVERNHAHLPRVASDFANAVGALRERTSASILVFFCPSSSLLPPSYDKILEKIQGDLTSQLHAVARVNCLDHAELMKLYPVAEHEDARSHRIGHIPYTNDYFVAIATLLTRQITARLKPQRKVIAVDCDNTLWKGICGEVGADGVELSPAYLRFQQTLVRQHDSGVLLCLCSKNNASDVEAVFRKHPEMPLREEHLISLRVNWESKSSNLRSLSKELGLALESFVFVDDSPVECAEVQAQCPSVLTLTFPDRSEDIEHFVDHIWAFDRFTVTEEAKRRASQYQENLARNVALEKAGSLERFLASLDLKVDVSPAQPTQLARVAELLQRTSQFNLTGIRRSIGEIEALSRSDGLQVLVTHVRDRFGDYGLVGAILFRRQLHALEVENFVLSCRALGRGVERYIFRELGRNGSENGLTEIVLRFQRTARNAPAWLFLKKTFARYMEARADSCDAAKDVMLTIPVQYVENLGSRIPADSLANEETESDVAMPEAASFSCNKWHETAYRFSRIPDVVLEVKKISAKNRKIEQRDYIPPRTAAEAALAKIWKDVLGLSDIGVQSDFLNLGGDSLLAVQVVARIGSALGRELSLYEFLEEPTTVERVARKLPSAVKADAPIRHMENADLIPLSPSQQRLWFLDQLERGSTAYHIPLAVRLKGQLDRAALQTALDALMQRHAVLRTIFIELDGEPAQRIEREGRFSLQFVDLRTQGSCEQEAEVLRQSEEEFTASFDLGVGPLIRGRLLQLRDDEHTLLATMHHIVSDGWSIGVLLREMGILYGACREGRPAPLAPLPIQYHDYAQWQWHWLTGIQVQKQLNYWKEHLEDAPVLLELPTDRPRPPVQSHRGGNVRVLLGSDLITDLKYFAKRFGVTLAMVFYAAWVGLLYRLSGQNDIVIGVPVANRRRAELEGLVGFFVNTLAIRIRLDSDPTVVELLESVKRILTGAFSNQDIPFERVVEALHPARSLAHNPIFQVMFVFQNTPRGETQSPGLTLIEQEVHMETAQFDLALELRESADDISARLNYSSDLFDCETIERWIGFFVILLRDMVDSSQLNISRLQLMSLAEQRRSILLFNSTPVPYPQEKLVHQLFEAQVDRTPGAIAAVYRGQSLTYTELNRRANELAHYLRNKGVGPDQLVGVCVERSLEMLVSLIAILKAGGAYVPLDPSYPTARLQYMLKDSSPNVLIIQSQSIARVTNTDADVIVIDRDWNKFARESACNVDADSIDLRSCHLCYVIYTSGSTGQPKGVMIEHRNVVNLWQGLERLYGHLAFSCVALNASLNFDASVQQIVHLLSGRTIFILPQECRIDPSMLLRFLDRNRVDAIDCTPSQLRSWLTSGLLTERRHPLSVVLVGGEAIEKELWSSLAQCGETEFFNVYGPTECTVDSTAARLRGDGGEPHIGLPMENRRIYILDHHGQPVPVGVIGEIFIGGAGIGRGYLKRPELTAEKFINDPNSHEPEARMYKTGDVGRWRADGTIEFLGRNDHQVKIRGFRIELGEIEAPLRRHVDVKDAVVIVREDVPGDRKLVAYVIPKDPTYLGMNLFASDLRRCLETILPSHMVPSAFVMLECLPATSSGKLDQRALPIPNNGISLSPHYEEPDGDIENALARDWQELLHVERVSRLDDFFELGGHSLLVLKLIFKINQSFGRILHVADVYRNSTLHKLASRIGGAINADELIDLSREATLSDDIQRKPGSRCVPNESVLLTGCTGFVGRFLLAQLVKDTSARIFCLVRGESQQQAMCRLKAALMKWELWSSEFERRVVVVRGDLSLSRLGVGEVTYQDLAESVDSIYHCATSMNHLETYAMAKPTNVDALPDLLRLATHGRPKLINYISTLGIFRSTDADEDRCVQEETPIEGEIHSTSHGYAASKWVSEKIFMIARERGIACNIFRLGLVWADAQQGRYDELQREYRILKTCLLSGYGIKDYRFELPPTPVDYVARSVVSLANGHPEGRGIFHISSSGQNVDGVFERCNEIAGTSLKLLPWVEWVSEIMRLHEEGNSLSAVPLIEYACSMDKDSFHEHQFRNESGRVRFDCQKTHRLLELSGITAPVVDNEMLRLHLESMFLRDIQIRHWLTEGSDYKWSGHGDPQFLKELRTARG